MKRSLVAAGSTIAAGLATCLGAEIWLRVRGFDPLGDLRRAGPVVIRPSENPALGYELVPSVSGVAWGCEVRVNADGFRDREYAQAKPAGTRRVVVLGDSISMGTAMLVEETFAKRLEVLLAPDRIEVLNLAVGGYDVLQEVAVLEQIGLSYQPDLVLVAFCINDVGVHSLNLEYIELLAHYDAPVFRLRIAQWWARRSARGELADWSERVNSEPEFSRRFTASIASLDGDAELESLRSSIAEVCAAEPALLTEHPFLSWYAETPKLGRLRWACERFARLGREHGVAVEIMFLPYLKSNESPSAYTAVRAIVAHECARAGLRFFAALPVLGEVEMRTLRQAPADALHLNAAGHELVARELKRVCLNALDDARSPPRRDVLLGPSPRESERERDADRLPKTTEIR